MVGEERSMWSCKYCVVLVVVNVAWCRCLGKISRFPSCDDADCKGRQNYVFARRTVHVKRLETTKTDTISSLSSCGNNYFP